MATAPDCRIALTSPRRYFELPLLVAWLAARQYQPEGGLSGRTNKLVDACYSHWVGGCWPFIEEALAQPSGDGAPQPLDLFDREGLARYILCCAQAGSGGLRDKPSK